jgi:phospholipid/cholesterol/gamma-HCH transport system permease protein
MAQPATSAVIVDGSCLKLSGRWVLDEFKALQALPPRSAEITALDFSDLTALDTAGATLLVDFVGRDQMAPLLDSARNLPESREALLRSVLEARQLEITAAHPRSGVLDYLAYVGEISHRGWQNFLLFTGFMGMALATLFALLPTPRRWRITDLVTQVHQTGLNAVPIVALLTFLVGAVVAFLGATVLSNFGASIYTVNLVSYSFLREFGVMLTAILMAGRTASAFTAQIGSMKVNEEVDALRVMSMSPMEVLVIPRLLAMLISLPLLTFVAMMSGLAGGAMVSLLSLDISLTRYIGIVEEIPLKHFVVGMAKAPVFALMIALIGCLEGFKVEGSARSVGDHTTSSVVQSIFVVILVDAIAAMICMEMGW